MKQKGKAPIKERVGKCVKKKLMSKVKESNKMLQWMKMAWNKLKWVIRASLESLFKLQWTMPREEILQNFLQTWETIQDG